MCPAACKGILPIAHDNYMFKRLGIVDGIRYHAMCDIIYTIVNKHKCPVYHILPINIRHFTYIFNKASHQH